MAFLLGVLLVTAASVLLAMGNAHAESPPSEEGPVTGIADLPWRTIGPYRGGRVTAVCGVVQDRQTYYMGATGGGVWKTTDGGVTWKNVSDGFFQTGSVGAVAVAPSDSENVYVGMGECSLRGDVSHGDGVYKSTDGGQTWNHLGLADTRHIARIVVDPDDPNRVFAAALGPLARDSDDRGVFRSVDGGETWQRVLSRDAGTGAIELRMSPHDPQTLYAAFWQVRRRPWGIQHAGPGSSIYKSQDGGETWRELTGTGGLPAGDAERIALACSPAREGRVWALVSTTEEKGLYLSDDGGECWRSVSNDPKLFVRPFYFNHLQADPQEPDTVFVLNYRLWKSADAGETFDELEDFHADHHDLWIDPADNRRMIDGCDGGACVSVNGGQTWTDAYNQPTAQFYSVTVDDRQPYNVYGPQQDWSTVAIPSRQWLGPRDVPVMHDTGASEAGQTQVDPTDPDRLFIGDHHWLLEVDRRSGAKRYIAPSDELNYGWGLRDVEFRFAWSFPVLLSKHDPSVLYVASQFVHRSTDRGRSWTLASDDLTLAEPKTLEPTPGPDGEYPVDAPAHWGPITRDSNGDQWYASVVTLAESPLSPRVMWTGSDDGLIHITRDGGENWSNVTPPELPRHTMVSKIDASPHGEGVACVAATRYRAGDEQSYLFLTDDFGQTWRRVDAGLPRGEFTRVLRSDPLRPDLLYCGTETGVYLSTDRGDHWTRMEGGLPRVPVYDLLVKGDDLVVATHGRGFWILDHLGVLRQWRPEIEREAFALFEPTEATLPHGSGSTPGRLDGAAFAYWLGARPERECHVEVRDARGALVSREQWMPVEPSEETPEEEAAEDDDDQAEADPLAPGMHVAALSLRYPDEEQVPDAILKGDVDVGPTAPPGEYRVTMTVDGREQTAPLSVVKDPRSSASDADLRARFEFGLRIRDKLSQVNRAILRLRVARDALTSGEGTNASKVAALTKIEDALIQHRVSHVKQLHAKPIKLNDKLYVLAGRVAASAGPPTEAQQALFDRLAEAADRALSELDDLLGDGPDDPDPLSD